MVDSLIEEVHITFKRSGIWPLKVGFFQSAVRSPQSAVISLFIAVLFLLLSPISKSDFQLSCKTLTTCASGEVCQTSLYCETVWVPDDFGAAGGDGGGSGAPLYGDGGGTVFSTGEWSDLNQDGNMDCWMGVTDEARLTSGFPTRNDGEESHSGIDVASDTGNYGHGANVRSLTSGEVYEIGNDEEHPNGVYARVEAANGEVYTYIHLKELNVQVGTQVSVGSSLGGMNCTGNCGEAREISSTHVHISRYSDRSRSTVLDPRENTGGTGCSI